MKRSASHRAKSVTAAAPRGAVKAAALTRAETAGASSKYFFSCLARAVERSAGTQRAASAPSWRRAEIRFAAWSRRVLQASGLTTR